MKLLLTGGSGMVGRNIVEYAAGDSAVEVVAPSSKEMNLLDPTAVASYVKHVGPDIIIHAAGRVGGIQANIAAPVAFLTENWDMGRNIMLAAKEAGITRLVNLGSSCMYPRNSPAALKEEDILSGTLEPTNEGYAIAKCAIAKLGHYIGKEDPRFQFKTLVPSNLYGRYDKFDPVHSHLVPAIIRKLHHAKLNGVEAVDIWGDGTARREFMYAGDLAEVILRLATHFDELPAIMNVGLGFDYSVNDYYRIGADVIGYSGRFEHDLTKPVGMMRKLTDVTRAHAWGWKSKTSLEDGLKATYAYYLESGAL
jgi:GDP-L-fucose synthase